MVDIDNFKKVNDSFGHAEGDIVLKKMAELMKDICAKYDANGSVGRWGGEEFMVLLPETSVEKAWEAAEELRLAFRDVNFSRAGHVTMSLGLTDIYSDDSTDTACKRVDQALYDSKKNGKNRTTRL